MFDIPLCFCALVNINLSLNIVSCVKREISRDDSAALRGAIVVDGGPQVVSLP